MRLRKLLAASALIAVATAPDSSAQTVTPKAGTKKEATAARVRPRPSYLRSRATRSALPPPPPIPVRASRMAASSRRTGPPAMIGLDDTGRRDQAGRPVAFYPSVRGRLTAGPRGSDGLHPAVTSAPHENAQKDPYKGAKPF